MSAVDIGNMFDGLRDLVVCAIVAQQEQNSLLLKQQCEQCELIGSLQKRVQYLEEALSEMACQLQQVRAQIGEHDQVAQQDTATRNAPTAHAVACHGFFKRIGPCNVEFPTSSMQRRTLQTGIRPQPEAKQNPTAKTCPIASCKTSTWRTLHIEIPQ